MSLLCICKDIRTLKSKEYPDGWVRIRCAIHKQEEEE